MPPQNAGLWTIEFYRDRRGRIPVEEFINVLPERERTEALRVIDLLQIYGLTLGMPHARPIEGMWEETHHESYRAL